MLKHITAFIVASIIFIIFITIAVIFSNYLMGKIVAGRDTVKVPKLIGAEFQQARNYCKTLSLEMDIIDEEYSTYPKGYIISQTPSPQRTIFKNRTIQTVISKGPKKVNMPNLIGFYFDDVEVLLTSYELKIGEVTQHYSNEIPAGHVISTEPYPGADIIIGKTVNFVISIGPDPLDLTEQENLEILPQKDSLEYFEENIF
jgi:serine/threonine-protein kinase